LHRVLQHFDAYFLYTDWGKFFTIFRSKPLEHAGAAISVIEYFESYGFSGTGYPSYNHVTGYVFCRSLPHPRLRPAVDFYAAGITINAYPGAAYVGIYG